MKSVALQNVSKIFSIGELKYTFKEIITEKLQVIFSSNGTKARREFYALKDISFEVEKGDVLGIIGDNGAGKSTLLRLISGVSLPTTGDITINGKVSSILEIGTGFHLELSGRQNIFLSGSILGMGRSEIRKQYSDIVHFSGLKDFIDVPIKRYSSGMYLRLAFSVLAFLNTDVILLDEIIYVGDAEFRLKSYNKIKELAQSGKTILLVSHDLASISDLCNKCIWLENGRIRISGNTAEIVRHYIDKSLLKHLNSTAEEQSRRLKAEMESLQNKIHMLESEIKEKERSLDNHSEKERTLATELERLTEESKELKKLKKTIQGQQDIEIKNASAWVPEKNWETEDTAPGNEQLKIKRIGVSSPDGKTFFDQGDDILLEIEYWKYTAEPLIIGLLARYNFNILAFGTSSHFSDAGVAGGLQNSRIGLIKNTCLIKKYLLNEGIFSFSFFFYNYQGEMIYTLQNAIYLKIHHKPLLQQKFNYKGNLMAPFAPLFQWT